MDRRRFLELTGLVAAAPVLAYPAVLRGQEPNCALRLRLYTNSPGDGTTFFVIEIPKDAEPADRIIVNTLYLQHTEKLGTLYRTKVNVVPFLLGVSVSDGGIPAPLKDIVRVEMEVVRRVCRMVEEF